MSEYQKPRQNNDLAQLIARIDSLERQIAQVPSRQAQRPDNRISMAIHQASHGLSPGDAVTSIAGAWSKSDLSNTIGVVESVIGLHGFVVVLSGVVDPSGFPDPLTSDFGQYLSLGIIGFKNAPLSYQSQLCLIKSGTSTFFIPPNANQQRTVAVLWNYSAPFWIGAVCNDGVDPTDPTHHTFTNVGGVSGSICDDYLPGYYLASQTSSGGTGWIISTNVNQGFTYYTHAEVISVSGGIPTFTIRRSISPYQVYPRSSSFLTGIYTDSFMSACETHTVAEAATWDVSFADLGTHNQTFTVGQLFKIAGFNGRTAILAPAVDSLLNVDTSGSSGPNNGDVLEWSGTVKKWQNQPHWPTGAVNSYVLTWAGGAPTWAAPSGGGGSSSLGLSIEANCGIYFTDATLGPKTTPATITNRPYLNKGEIMYCDGTGPDGTGHYLPVRLPPPTSNPAILLIDSAKVVQWTESPLDGQVLMRAGGTINFSYSLTLGNSTNSGYFQVGISSKNGSVKFYLPGTTTVDLTGTPATTGKTLSLVEIDVCDSSGNAKKMMVIGSAAY